MSHARTARLEGRAAGGVGMLDGALSGAWGFTLAIFVASRAFFFVVGAVAAASLDDATLVTNVLPPAGALHEWANWDGAWYAAIATDGYSGIDPSRSTAFFPLYPLVVGAANALPGGVALWGVVVSTACTLAALFFLYRLAEERFGRRVARASTLALALFPTAFFLDAVYTEALFLALSTGCLWALAVRRDPLLAGVLAAATTATRNVGIFLAVPLALAAWQRRGRARRALAVLALVPAGLLAYMAYLWARFDDPLRFADAQREGWGRRLTNPLDTLERAWRGADRGLTYLVHPDRVFRTDSPQPPFDVAQTTSLAFLVLVAVLAVVAFRRLPLGEAIYGVAVAVSPLLYASPIQPALMSLSRFVLASAPLFVALGVVLARSRLALLGWLALSTVAAGWFTTFFVTWRWVA